MRPFVLRGLEQQGQVGAKRGCCPDDSKHTTSLSPPLARALSLYIYMYMSLSPSFSCSLSHALIRQCVAEGCGVRPLLLRGMEQQGQRSPRPGQRRRQTQPSDYAQIICFIPLDKSGCSFPFLNPTPYTLHPTPYTRGLEQQGQRPPRPRQRRRQTLNPTERIFIELMTSDRKLEASWEG